MDYTFKDDFFEYYRKAKILEDAHIRSRIVKVNDPLMDNVPIYNCVHRRQAGFSNALQDTHGCRNPVRAARLPRRSLLNDPIKARFLHLYHRFTGSGASFEHDHGYRNSHIANISDSLENGTVSDAIEYIVQCTIPMVTSKGNQPPSLKNPYPQGYRLAMQYYFGKIAFPFVCDYSYAIEKRKIRDIKNGVDFALDWHGDRGFKRWKFVLTAFIMDDAEYYPDDVDPDSDCYHGPNAIKAWKLMFDNFKMKDIDKHVRGLCDEVGAKPYDLEDSGGCDMVRYWVEFTPKTYRHLDKDKLRNNSILKVNGEYPKHIQARINKVIYGKE